MHILLPIAYAKPMPGWMHSAWPECILPRLDAFGRRMHSAADAFAVHGGVGPRRGARGRGGSHSGVGPPNASRPDAFGGRMHPAEAVGIQARPNASSQGSMGVFAQRNSLSQK